MYSPYSIKPTLLCFIFLHILTINVTFGNSPNKDFETIKSRIRDGMLKGDVNVKHIHQYINTIQEDGSWPHINYEDVSRTGFEHSKHLEYLVEMAHAYVNKDSEWRGVKKLKSTILKALDFWNKHDFICENWWWNQIGTPRLLIQVLYLMDRNLSAQQIEGLLTIISRANLEASGARPSGDRIKIAGTLAKRLLYQHDTAQFNRVIKVIEGEIKFSTGRGMQQDYSFHHRKDGVNNTLSYGMSYADAFVEWAVYVAQTSYAFSEVKTHQLVDYYLDGIAKMMVYGAYPDLGAKNRSISRAGALKAIGAETIGKLKKITQYRWDELTDLENVRKGYLKNKKTHSTFFWKSEYYVHQRLHYFTSVRMFSARNHNMEVPYNEEGVRNHHLGDASNFISVTGQEYFNIFPVYDWQKIPGATIAQKPELPPESELQQEGITTFVGGVTDGIYGAAACDFKSPHDPVKAKKAYFFFDKEYVCLGAGISSKSRYPIATSINQRLLFGDVLVGEGENILAVPQGEIQFSNASWVLSDSIAYIFPHATALNLAHGKVKGSWYSINRQSKTSRDTVVHNVFNLWIDHGKNPDSAKYAYIVVPVMDEAATMSYQQNPEISILVNQSALQAVQHHTLGLTQIVFHQAGSIEITDKLALEVDSPGLIMLKVDNEGRVTEITVSDPTRKLSRIHFTLSTQFESSDDHVRTTWNGAERKTHLAITLPTGDYAGSSVTIASK